MCPVIRTITIHSIASRSWRKSKNVFLGNQEATTYKIPWRQSYLYQFHSCPQCIQACSHSGVGRRQWEHRCRHSCKHWQAHCRHQWTSDSGHQYILCHQCCCSNIWSHQEMQWCSHSSHYSYRDQTSKHLCCPLRNVCPWILKQRGWACGILYKMSHCGIYRHLMPYLMVSCKNIEAHKFIFEEVQLLQNLKVVFRQHCCNTPSHLKQYNNQIYNPIWLLQTIKLITVAIWHFVHSCLKVLTQCRWLTH